MKFLRALVLTQFFSLLLTINAWATSTPSPTPTPKPTPVPGVYTWHVDPQRTGLNSSEIALTPSTVNATKFGKLFSVSVDGHVYAHPLYVAKVNMGSAGIHNVTYVATEHDSVYAIDADSGGTPLWKASFINSGSGITTVPNTDLKCSNISPEVGITSTPVIDPSSSTIYVVAKTKENGSYFFKLHALDLATGAEKFGGPKTLTASVSGTGDGSSGGVVSFDAFTVNQRSALLLNQGVVYIATASHCDNGPYHGWILGYNATTLAQSYVFNTTPNGSDGGIWMSGGGPAADYSGNIIVGVGNGTYDSSNEYGQSVIKLTSGLQVLDWFTPYNQAALSAVDSDMGVGVSIVLPKQAGANPHLTFGYGKAGKLYLLNRDNMGKYNGSNDNQIVQVVPGVVHGQTLSSGAYWNSYLYFAGNNGPLVQFQLTNGLLSTSPVHSDTSLNYPSQGSTVEISSNGNLTPIAWTIVGGGTSAAILRANDGTNVSKVLYNSSTAGVTLPNSVKFTSPLIVNGKVYIGTQSTLEVFGLH